MKILKKVASKIKRICLDYPFNSQRIYYKYFRRYAFVDCKCKSYEQFEASIIRLYHTIEKGLSYSDYRAGFGEANVNNLLLSMEQYAERFDTDKFFYQTALSVLNAYVEKNKKYGHIDKRLEDRIKKLPGTANQYGGVIEVSAPSEVEIKSMNYEQLVLSRHSIRQYSDKPVNIDKLKKAVQLAQYTPSACNRQGWKTRIISDKKLITEVLIYQNGNRGFGDKFDKLLVITGDLRCFQKNREVFQLFIDGGMYAQSVLNSLYYYGIGSVPLSASLTVTQDKMVHKKLKLGDAERLIMFVGVGNYPDSCLTTRSERKKVSVEVR